MKLNFLKSNKNNFLKVCFKSTLLFALILAVITTSLFFVYDSQYKAGNVVFAPTIVYTFAGEGTLSNPYQINNSTDLKNLSTNVNNGTDYLGKYFKVTTNINLNNISFTPIGNSDKSIFAGIFDGGNHIIQGLNVNVTTEYAGLFGRVRCATIQNIIVSGSVTGTDSCYYAGGIVAINWDSIFINCTNWCDVIVSNLKYNNSECRVGGIAGCSESGVFLEDCVSQFRLCKNLGDIVSPSFCAGGICGCGGGSFYKCFNSGDVSAGDSDKANRAYAAGIVADPFSSPIIQYCYNTGNIKSNAKLQIDTYYFTLATLYKHNNSYFEIDSSGKEVGVKADDKRGNYDILADGEKSGKTYYLYPESKRKDSYKLSKFEDTQWQLKNITYRNSYACGICYRGYKVTDCYNKGVVSGNGFYKTEWTYKLRIYYVGSIKTKWSDVNTFTFSFKTNRIFPICVTSESVSDCYYNVLYTSNEAYYKINTDNVVYFKTSDSVDKETSINAKGAIYLQITKDKNSNHVQFFVISNSKKTKRNIFERGRGNKVFGGNKEYITYEQLYTIQGTETSNLKTIFENDSTWATNPAINDGYPVIEEMYWGVEEDAENV